MKEFMSLREFFLLKDPHNPTRSIHRNEKMNYYPLGREPESLLEDGVNRYDIAKESWEKYGSEGPPFGAKVEMLTSGHPIYNGGHGILRGVYISDPRFFTVSHLKYDSRISIVCRETWFVHMKVIQYVISR